MATNGYIKNNKIYIYLGDKKIAISNSTTLHYGIGFDVTEELSTKQIKNKN